MTRDVPPGSAGEGTAGFRRTRIAAFLGLALLQAPALSAQPLSSIIPQLFGQEIILEAGFHQGHFLNETSAAAARALNGSLVSQLASSPPVNSSAGGFTYNYDPVEGTYERTSDSFGPIFAERPETLGKGRFNYGVSFLILEYDSLDDIALDNGELTFDLTHEDVTGDGSQLDNFVEGDLIEAETFLGIESETTALFINWGVTDRIDLGLVVPMVSVRLDARVDATVRELATEGHLDLSGRPQPVHEFEDGVGEKSFVAGGSASGISDLIVRAKYNFKKNDGKALSAAAEVRLPTGDEEDLLGTGETQIKLFLIGGASFGKTATHLNLGTTLSGGDLPDELNLAAGLDAAIHPRVTLALDVLSRTLFDAPQILRTEESFPHRICRDPSGRPCAGAPRDLPIGTSTRRSLSVLRDDQSLIYASLGFKFNPWGNLLITANMLYSLTAEGLQDEDVIPLVGVDYSF